MDPRDFEEEEAEGFGYSLDAWGKGEREKSKIITRLWTYAAVVGIAIGKESTGEGVGGKRSSIWQCQFT